MKQPGKGSPRLKKENCPHLRICASAALLLEDRSSRRQKSSSQLSSEIEVGEGSGHVVREGKEKNSQVKLFPLYAQPGLDNVRSHCGETSDS